MVKRRGKVKQIGDRDFSQPADWVRKLAEETTAFEVVRVSRQGDQWDQIITLSVKPGRQQVGLFVLTRQQISPSTVLSVLPKFKSLPSAGVPILCAPYISPRVAELCQEQNVGYLDSVGNCRIAGPGLFVHVSGRPNRPTTSKAVDPFSKKSSRIVRTLLANSSKGWQVQQLAQQSDVSLGLVSKVKTALLEEAYLEERDRLLFVRDPIKLLQGWATEYRPQVKRLQLFAISRPQETEKRLADWCRSNTITYALTQLSAAWRYSPMVRYDKCVAYIDSKLEAENKLKDLLEQIDAREVETGANCTLWITDDPAVFTDAREFDGVNAVSPLQLYLDLKVLSGRGEDAAQEILEREL
jgi:hypothetical protein